MTGLRVGYVLGTTDGGTGRHVAMLAEGCAAAGATVRVFGPAGTESFLRQRGPAAAGFDVVEITDRPRPARDAAAIWRLRRLLAAMAPQVVHAHGLRAGALAALALRRRSGTGPALVVTVHNAPPAGRAAAIYRLLERLVARRADLVLCVSPDLSARMRLAGARQVERAIVPAQQDHQAPGQAAVERVRSELGTNGRPVVLAVGRLAPQKGHDTLLTAAARWRGRRPEPLVLIAGTGPLAAELTELAAGLGVEARLLGPRDDVPVLLAAADVFVLPSRWEGQPLALQEALRAGLPIVAADVGGVGDLAGDAAALLVPAGDPAALAAAVLRVLDDPVLAASLAQAASLRAASLPDGAEAVRAVLGRYEELAGGQR